MATGSSGTGDGREFASTLSVRLCVGDVTTVHGPLPLSSLAVEVSGSSSPCVEDSFSVFYFCGTNLIAKIFQSFLCCLCWQILGLLQQKK